MDYKISVCKQEKLLVRSQHYERSLMTPFETFLILISALFTYPLAFILELRRGYRRIWIRTYWVAKHVFQAFLNKRNFNDRKSKFDHQKFVDQEHKKRHRRGHRGGKKHHKHNSQKYPRETRW